MEILAEVRGNPFELIEFIEDYILANVWYKYDILSR
jgi:hypothetical protein